MASLKDESESEVERLLAHEMLSFFVPRRMGPRVWLRLHIASVNLDDMTYEQL
jgi:hypothetical protein